MTFQLAGLFLMIMNIITSNEYYIKYCNVEKENAHCTVMSLGTVIKTIISNYTKTDKLIFVYRFQYTVTRYRPFS